MRKSSLFIIVFFDEGWCYHRFYSLYFCQNTPYNVLTQSEKRERKMENEIVICPECGTQVEAPIDAICSDCQADQAAAQSEFLALK